jgi:hypothetical protein
MHKTGLSGMSIAALARLCGVEREAIRKLLRRLHGTKTRSIWLNMFAGKPLYLAPELLGQAKDMEAYTPIGPVDLVTKTEIIEIKRVEDWKTAFGQVIAKSQSFPKHAKRIHLFGESSRQLKKITEHCQTFDVLVTFEKMVLETIVTT